MAYDDHSLDLVFHALADPARRSIVDRLSENPASVSELARPLAMTLPSVMQHLQVLEASGLVSSRKAGRVRICRIDPVAVRKAENWLAERRMELEHRQRRIGVLLARRNDDPLTAWPVETPKSPRG